MHEYEILLIENYIEYNCQMPDVHERIEFEKVSHKRWAAEQIIQILLDFPTSDPELLVLEFAATMRAVSARQDHSAFIFQCAAEAAEEILELL